MILNQKLDGEAVPFILIKEKVEGNKVRYQFQLTQQATQIFNSIKNKKLAIASVAGPQRSGKSFLSNRLLKRMTGFAIGPSTMPCTKGLWIWGKPLDIDAETVLIIMDTQGLNSVRKALFIQERDINIDLKIFSLSILLSSVFIYNSLGHIDQKALQNMSCVLKISQNLKVTKQTNQKESQIAKYFPYFYWVLRDFSLDLKGMSESQYLQNSLKQIGNDKNDAKNQIRSKIKKLFIHRRCQCFPRPINEQDKLAHIEKLKYQDLRQKFRTKIQEFQKTFYETLPLKMIKGKPVTGGIYLNLVRQYLEAMNSGKVPQILTSLQRVLQSQARSISQQMQKLYNQAMSKVMKNNEGPYDDHLLERNHRDFIKQIQIKLSQKYKNWSDIGKTALYKNKLIQTLEKNYQQKLKRNNQLSEALCASEMNKLFNQYNNADVTSLQSLTDNIVRLKFQQFTKKIQPYLEKCKSPKKQVFFLKKFPKKIFDFFDLFISKIKGLYNEQIIRLKAETKNYQGEVESVKRIMKQQQNLLTEKQKQVEAIQYQKDMFRRQKDKLQKMKQFQQETSKMNKGQLKESLQTYKVQVLQLQQRIQQLQLQNSKLKQELSSKKFQISNFTKDQKENSQTKQTTDEDCPNQIISNFTFLNNKLKSMRNFYQSKQFEENIDQNILSQLQKLRTQKHQALQKLRAEFRTKQQKYRIQKTKERQNNDKTIQIINKHLQDVKNQNIELQQRLNSKPESQQKLKNFITQRKKFEESLKLKQNNINSLTALNKQIQKKLDKKNEEHMFIESQLAILKAQKANFESYKETFAFILRQSINWVTNKNNKLKHSIKTLNGEDLAVIKGVFKELNLEPF